MAFCPVIFGCRGPALDAWERDFFAEVNPVGVMLFAESCQSPDQIRGLLADLKDCVGRADLAILIDQEGGRVQRLNPPHWRAMPPAARFGALAARDPEQGREAVALNARLLGDELAGLGITADCVPVLDLRRSETHDVIGDRAYGADPALVAELGRVVCDTLLAMGVLPMIKHMPGHGRAVVDSHHELPRVAAGRDELAASDFEAFRRLADAPWAMTAHIVFEAIDPERPATISPTVIGEVIRGTIGFEGMLVSDDIGMEALSGTPGERAAAALSAGCDLVLHCSGDREEMREVAAAAERLSADGEAALGRVLARLPAAPERLEAAEKKALLARLDALLGAA